MALTKTPRKFPGLYAIKEIEVRLRPTGLKVPFDNGTIRTPEEAANIFKAMSDRSPNESLMALHLDPGNRPIGVQEVARGSANIVHLQPRDLFAPAMATGASSVIISHNHPAGDATPSDADVDLTRKIKAGGNLIGVPMIDHIVIGDEDAYTFREGRTTNKLWDKDKSYSTGGWGTALLAAGTVGALLLAVLLRGRSKAPVVVGSDKPKVQKQHVKLGLDVFVAGG